MDIPTKVADFLKTVTPPRVADTHEAREADFDAIAERVADAITPAALAEYKRLIDASKAEGGDTFATYQAAAVVKGVTMALAVLVANVVRGVVGNDFDKRATVASGLVSSITKTVIGACSRAMADADDDDAE